VAARIPLEAMLFRRRHDDVVVKLLTSQEMTIKAELDALLEER
jgi:hypothetical protein